MPSTPAKSRWAAPLALVLLLTSIPTATHAGVISDMIARRRAERRMKSQSGPSEGGFQGGGLAAASTAPSMTAKFKKRFALKGRGEGKARSSYNDDVFATRRDSGLFRTSR